MKTGRAATFEPEDLLRLSAYHDTGVAASGGPSAQSSVLSRLLSEPRMVPYLAETDGNVRSALRLYRWNIELSGAVYQALHLFEVVLRNAMDTQLRPWNASQHRADDRSPHSEDWTFDPAPLLLRLVRPRDLEKAVRRAQHTARQAVVPRPPTHGEVMTQLAFGTWRFLLPDADPGRQYLWRAALHRAFPHLRRAPRGLVHDVEHVYRLRNRVAHLEPLLRGGVVEARLGSMRRVLAEIEPRAEEWLVSQQQITAVLGRRPRST